MPSGEPRSVPRWDVDEGVGPWIRFLKEDGCLDQPSDRLPRARVRRESVSELMAGDGRPRSRRQ